MRKKLLFLALICLSIVVVLSVLSVSSSVRVLAVNVSTNNCIYGLQFSGWDNSQIEINHVFQLQHRILTENLTLNNYEKFSVTVENGSWSEVHFDSKVLVLSLNGSSFVYEHSFE